MAWTRNSSSGHSHSPPPYHPTRRNFIKGVAIAGGLALAGVAIKTEVDSQRSAQDEAPYQGWERYQNSTLPSSLILKIGQNIQDSDYPGFSEVGKIILRSQTDYSSLDQFYPRLTKPMQVGFTDLVRQDHASAEFENDVQGIGVDVTVHNKKTGEQKKIVLADPESYNVSAVLLENSMYISSSMAKRILLVKEFSHLLYMNQFKDLLFSDLTSRFDITTSAKTPLAEFLAANADMYGDPNKPSMFGHNFDNGLKMVDYAGYWHIMPAMGVVMERNALPAQDLAVMSSDKNSFELAKARGLLIEPSKGNFVWKEDIGPFSQEWQDVMKVTF